MCLLVLVTGAGLASSAHAQTAEQLNFDHLKTGFPLDGNHRQARCESCHLKGIFKGTPRTCQTCHTSGSLQAGGNTVKPSNHLPTTQGCETCHNTQTFSNATFDHKGVVAGTCQTCHNGNIASGKTSNHIPYQSVSGVTTAGCDTCHKSGFVTWTPGLFHANVSVSSQCATCHLTASFGLTSKPTDATHSSVSGGCENCHKSTSSWMASGFVHSAANAVGTGTCDICHNGVGATGKPGNHIPYQFVSGATTAGCDTCHKSGFASWSPGSFHANVKVSTDCSTCHLTANFGLTAKPNDATHSGVTTKCETCHGSTDSWTASVLYQHAASNAIGTGTCVACHNGSVAMGKPAAHIPTGSVSCDACHKSQTSFATAMTMNHTAVVGQACASCHTGAFPPADGKPATHIPYQSVMGASSAGCDTCHKSGFASWSPGYFHNNISVSTQCATCHLSAAYGLTAKPADTTHSSITGSCETCHTSTSSWTAGTTFVHSPANAVGTGTCDTCHNGSTATGKPSSHIPITVATAKCDACHKSQTAFATALSMSHTAVTGQACASCHTGAFPPADGKPATHIPYQSVVGASTAGCDTCHKSGFASWSPGYFHNNVSVSTQCDVCHLSAAYGLTAKPANATHASVTGSCETCHKSTSSWTAGTTFVHSAANAVGTGTCDTCHNGSTAMGKSATHIPISVATAKCDACHKSQTAFTVSVSMNHAAVSAQPCKSCHSGSFTAAGATAKPGNHIPEAQLLNGTAMDCNACHTSTASGGFSSMRMNHNNSQGSGAGWCKSCHATGTAYLGSMQKMALNHRNKSASYTDCSQSGCHRPLGNTGNTYKDWN